mgnify:CR=1 FL=1
MNIVFDLISLAILVLVITAAALYASWLFIPFVWFIPAIAMVFLNAVIEKVFRKYMTEEELAQEQENDMMRK